MSTLLETPETFSFLELQEQLGGVPAHRVLMRPPPGTATEDVVLRMMAQDRICELIDGTLVEKAMGMFESATGMEIGRRIGNYLESNDIGFIAGADGTMKVRPGRVRIPDVAYYSYESCEGVKREAIPFMAPDLSIEVLSESNTLKEMEIKRRDLFGAGTRLVWEIDPEARTAEVFTGPDDSTQLGMDGVLDGADVLPGFKLPLAELFARVEKAMKQLNG